VNGNNLVAVKGDIPTVSNTTVKVLNNPTVKGEKGETIQ